MANFKFVKSATALVLGASVLTTAVVVPGADASAKTTYKVTSKGTLVNAKTNKAIKGYKSYKGKLYKDGKKFTGLYNKKYYYKSGVKATGTYAGAYYYKGYKKVTTGTYNGAYYYKGVKKVTTGTYNKAYYVKGVKKVATGTYNGAYYVSGVKKVTTGTYAGAYYVSGVKKVTTGTYAGAYYVKGIKKVTTGLYDSKYYKDGVLNVGLALFGEKLYNGAEENKGLIKFEENGKFYFDADLANGLLKDANGVEKLYKDGAIVDLAVDSVSAINTTSATINFNQAVSADTLDKAAVTVTNKATGEKQVVKAVTLSDDKKSAKVEFYSEVAANTTYTVSLKNGEETLTGDLVIGSLAPASVQVADQVLENNGTIAYKVLDANGVDVTSLYPATSSQVTFDTTATNGISTDGVVTLTAGTSAKVKVVIKDATDATKVLAESAQVNVSVAANDLSSISTVTLSDGSFDKPNTTIYGPTGTLKAEFKDQFGNKFTADDFATGEVFAGYSVSYESQNLDVAVVDKSTGNITALSNGTVPVKVTLTNKDGKVVSTKTVEITVKAAKATDKVVADKSSLTLTNTVADSATVTLNVKDQYGNGFNSTPTVAVFEADGTTPATAVSAGSVTPDTTVDFDGQYTFDLTTAVGATAGTYVVKVTADDKTTTLNVVVKASGSATQYVVKDLNSTFDIKDSTPVSIEPSVYTADAEGLTVEDVTTGATIAVSGNDNFEVASGKVAAKSGYTPKAGDKFTVTVKYGATTVAQKEVTIVDTTAKYTTDFTAYSVSAKANDTLADKLESIVKVYIDGKEDTTNTYTVTGLTFVSTDSKVADNAVVSGEDYSVGTLAEGTATVLVNSITVNDGAADKTITFSTPVKFTVNVAK
ncbi:Ig-like domain-containing protein [Rummeliibacillus sp. JY-2-4R]